MRVLVAKVYIETHMNHMMSTGMSGGRGGFTLTVCSPLWCEKGTLRFRNLKGLDKSTFSDYIISRGKS